MVDAIRLNYNNGFRLPDNMNVPKEKREPSQFKYWLIYHRTTILLVAIFAIAMFSIMFAAYCKDWSDFGGHEPPKEVGGILGMLVDEGGWIDQIAGTEDLSSYADILVVEASSSGVTIGGAGDLGNLYGILSGVNTIFKGIAWALAIIFWVYGFSEMLMQSNGQLVVEQMIKKFMLLVIAAAVIDNSFVICCEIMNAGTALMRGVLDIIQTSTETAGGTAAFREEVFNACWTNVKVIGIDLSSLVSNILAVGFVITMLIPWIVSKICGIILNVLCWSRALEICIFAAISPIMFIDIGTTRDLTHSSTARALKNMLSLAMQGCMILISLAVCKAMMNGVLSNDTLDFSDKIWDITLIAILQIGTIGKTQGIAKQALGV